MYQNEQTLWWYQTLDALVEAFVAKRAKNGPLNIFDAGCGTGRLVKRFEKYGTTAGIDYADEAVAYARQQGIDSVSKGDVNTWNGPEHAYDVIISLDVLCHSDVPDEQKIIQQWYKALRPGGVLILNLPAFTSLLRHHDMQVRSKRRYRTHEVVTMVKKAGFNITIATYRLPHVFVLLWLKKMWEKITQPKEITSDVKTIPSFLNIALRRSGAIDNFRILAGIQAPFGSSVFVVASKEKDT